MELSVGDYRGSNWWQCPNICWPEQDQGYPGPQSHVSPIPAHQAEWWGCEFGNEMVSTSPLFCTQNEWPVWCFRCSNFAKVRSFWSSMLGKLIPMPTFSVARKMLASSWWKVFITILLWLHDNPTWRISAMDIGRWSWKCCWWNHQSIFVNTSMSSQYIILMSTLLGSIKT